LIGERRANLREGGINAGEAANEYQGQYCNFDFHVFPSSWPTGLISRKKNISPRLAPMASEQ
jgi:hypothetical protein